MSISGNYAGCAIGAFVNGLDNLPSFEALIGKKLAVVNWYHSWPHPFPVADAETVVKNGSVPLITWEPWGEGDDLYVEGFIAAAKTFGRPLFLRFAHEMNGDWYPWSGAPARFKKQWSYIYNVKEQLRADNINMVFCPNHYDKTAAPLEDYYPGDRYVDWVGLDGYNWGEGKRETFDDIFKRQYGRLTALTAKPLMIAEFASAPGRKAEWIAETFARIRMDYPRIKLACWFNIDKERDWRADSDQAAAAAFKNALQNGYFLSKILN